MYSERVYWLSLLRYSHPHTFVINGLVHINQGA